MTNELEIQRVFTAGETPDDEQFHDWFGLFSKQLHVKGSLVIRLVDEAESQQLNLSYRGKDSSTNVLSFPFEAPANIEDNHIGDLVICVSVVNREAMAQNKPQNHHWAHIVLHGILHLLGYDHIDDDEATKMEQMEIDLLNKLGIGNPYEAQ